MLFFFSFTLPECLPFRTQTKCSFIAVFGHRTGSAVLPQGIPHSSLKLPYRYSHLCEQAGGNLQYVHRVICRQQGGICRKGSLVVKAIPTDLFTSAHPFLIESVWMQPKGKSGKTILLTSCTTALKNTLALQICAFILRAILYNVYLSLQPYL